MYREIGIALVIATTASACRFTPGGNAASLVQAGTFPKPGTGMVVGHDNPSGSNFDGIIDDLQIFSAIVAP